jgi:hypothetical protein
MVDATEFGWPGNDFVIIHNPTAVPWNPVVGGGNLKEIVIDRLGKFVPSPLEDWYHSPKEKGKLEALCQQKKPSESSGTIMQKPTVPKCK